MKTLLIYPSAKGDSEQKDKHTNNIHDMEPLGIAYIGAICKKRGQEVKLIHQIDETNEELFKQIDEMQPDYLMLSALTFNFNNAVKIAEHVKEKYQGKVKTIIGGYHVSGSLLTEGETKVKQKIKDGTFDFVVNGEGEKTIDELLNYIESENNNFSEVDGIAFYDKESKSVIINEKRDRLTNKELDEIGLPLREGLPMKRYKDLGFSFPPVEKQSFATIYSQRGCYGNCEFCQTPVVWNDRKSSCKKGGSGCNSCKSAEICGFKKNRVTSRPTESIIEEIEYLIKEYGTNCLYFRDETFGVDKERANEFLDKMIEKGIGEKVKWTCMLRADSIVDTEGNIDKIFLNKLKDAGCHTIPIGIEHPLFLDRIKKGVTQEQIKLAFDAINEIGLKPMGLMMIGWPEETKESLDEVNNFIKDIKMDRVRISFVTPLDGTDLSKRAELINKNTDADEMSTDKPVIHCPELEKQLGGQSHVEYLEKKRDELLESVYNNEAYKERQKQHIINAEKIWGKKWRPLFLESTIENLKFIKECEVKTFDSTDLEKLAKEKLKEIEEKKKPAMLGGMKIK